MDISVVIPSFNRAATLPRALDSVLGQDCAPLEVILVDDGSTDGTADLIRASYPRVRYCRQDNHGVSHARNRGIEMARGDWIALLDSDDAWRPRKLARQREALDGEPAARVCHTDEIWIRNGVRVNPRKKHAKKGGWIFRDCLPLCAMSPSSVLIHRDVFDEAGSFDESLPACEDYDLWLRICSRYPVLFVDEPLVIKHGGHEDQLSRRYWGMDRFRVRALEKLLRSGNLNIDDRRAALRMLRDKTRVLMAGAEKRNNRTLLNECEALLTAVSRC